MKLSGMDGEREKVKSFFEIWILVHSFFLYMHNLQYETGREGRKMSYNQNYTMGQAQNRNRVRRVEIDADEVIIRTNKVRIEGARKRMQHGYNPMDVAGAEDYNYGDYGNEYDGNVGGVSNRNCHCKSWF